MIFYPGQVEVCLLQCLSNIIIVLLLCFSQWAPVLVTAIEMVRLHQCVHICLLLMCCLAHTGQLAVFFTQSLQVFFNHYWKMNHTCHKRKTLLTPFPFPELMLRF